MTEWLRSREGVPWGDWRWHEVVVLAEYGHCEWCGARILYAHRMTHPDWPKPIWVGCVCVENRSPQYEQARLAEAKLKRMKAGEAKWVARPWRRMRGSPDVLYVNVDYRNLRDARSDNPHCVHVVVYLTARGWRGKVSDRQVQGWYPERHQAQLAAYDALCERYW